MSDLGKTNTPDADDAEMQNLRDLILGQDKEQITQVLKHNAREVVSEVVIEALHDRHKQGDELNQVLVPIVEKSVQKPVNNHSEQFVGYLYPLVGRLVRKSVTAFLSEFLEKTNELIENSFTFKGIAWRFKAWQAGVSFSQYVATQTFVFRIEQVLLIHNETGILLNSVARDSNDATDGDLVSSMLTAINDFVADSFNPTEQKLEQNLEVVKTDDFSLVIKRGPQLILVAAFSGNIPQNVSTKFQVTNEYIHKLYAKDIADFSGDTLPFEPTSQQLEECLLAELRPDAEQNKKKRPIWAVLLVAILVGLFGFWSYLGIVQNQLLNQVLHISDEPGIIVHQSDSLGWRDVSISILRDPDAKEVESWMAENQIDTQHVTVHERGYLSLENALIRRRLANVLARYPQLDLKWQQDLPILSGTLSNSQRQALAGDLYAIAGLQQAGDLINSIDVQELETIDEDNPEILRALFEINTAKIDSTQIEFKQGQSELNEQAKNQLLNLAEYVKTSIELSKKLELNVGLIIMGASDSSGSAQFNQSLSRKRASAAKQFLVEQGIDAEYLNAIGLGVVELKTTGSGARKVIFNIINFRAQ